MLASLGGFTLSTSGGVVNAGFTTASVFSGGPAIDDQRWHHIVVTTSMPGLGGNIIVYVDGNEVINQPTGGTYSPGVDLSVMSIGGSGAFEGYMANVSLWNTILGQATVTAHYQASQTGWPSQMTGARVAAILANSANSIGFISIDPGTVQIQAKAMDPTPTSLLTEINNVLDTEEARFWQDLAGNVWFRDRSFLTTNARSLSVQMVINDQGDAEGVMYQGASPT